MAIDCGLIMDWDKALAPFYQKVKIKQQKVHNSEVSCNEITPPVAASGVLKPTNLVLAIKVPFSHEQGHFKNH